MPFVIVIALFRDGKKHEEEQWQDGGYVSGGADSRDGLRDSHAEEVEVAEAAKLEEKLLGEEVEDVVARCPNDV